jgi:DNA-binding MurR/RpiR family transcriptional regulator
MKTDFHPTGWSAEAASRFAGTALGAKLASRLGSGTAQQAKLAEFVLRNPLTAAARGIEELASGADVSTATISRFARDLGCAGFAEFRARLADAIGASLDPVAKLKDRFDRPGGADPAADSLAAARAHLDALADSATAARLHRAAGTVAAAASVYVMGFGLSAHLAAMLVLHLQPYRDRVINVVQFGGTEVAAGRLSAIGEGDLLVAISFPRYAQDALHLARFARDRGARVMALTDSPASPLARWADDVILAPALHSVLSSSQAPALALIEALTAAFVLSDPAHVERAERLSAALRNFLHTDRDG